MTPEQHTDYIVACISEAGSMYPEDAARFLAEHDAHRRAEDLRAAGDVADELIVGLDRTGAPDSIVKTDAYRAYSDRLHELADGEPLPGTRARTRTFGFRGQDPFLTVRLVFGPDLTDAGVDAVAEQIGTAARLAVGMTAEDVAERGKDTQDDLGTGEGSTSYPCSACGRPLADHGGWALRHLYRLTDADAYAATRSDRADTVEGGESRG